MFLGRTGYEQLIIINTRIPSAYDEDYFSSVANRRTFQLTSIGHTRIVLQDVGYYKSLLNV